MVKWKVFLALLMGLVFTAYGGQEVQAESLIDIEYESSEVSKEIKGSNEATNVKNKVATVPVTKKAMAMPTLTKTVDDGKVKGATENVLDIPRGIGEMPSRRAIEAEELQDKKRMALRDLKREMYPNTEPTEVLTNNGRSYWQEFGQTYNITFTVPELSSEDYYGYLTVLDKLPTEFITRYEDFKIVDETGEDVSDRFYLGIDDYKYTSGTIYEGYLGATVYADAKNSALDSPDFYGHTYTLSIYGQVSKMSYEQPYIEDSWENIATLDIDEEIVESNPVITEFNLVQESYDTQIMKHMYDMDEEIDHGGGVERLSSSRYLGPDYIGYTPIMDFDREIGDVVAYEVTTMLGDGVKEIHIKDILPKGFELLFNDEGEYGNIHDSIIVEVQSPEYNRFDRLYYDLIEDDDWLKFDPETNTITVDITTETSGCHKYDWGYEDFAGWQIRITYIVKVVSDEDSVIDDGRITLINDVDVNNIKPDELPKVRLPQPELSLGGKVWIDEDYNQVLNSGETIKDGETLHLFKYDETTDNYTKVSETTSTNTGYTFTDLEFGKYKVGYEYKEDDYYWLVDKGVGSDNGINSKFNTTIPDDDKYYYTDEIVINEDSTTYNQDNIHLGIRPNNWLNLEKTIYSGDVDVDGTTVQTDDELTITINYSIGSEDGYGVAKNVQIIDELDDGFEYISGTLKHNNSSISDSYMTGGKLNYTFTTVEGNTSGFFQFGVKVVKEEGTIPNIATGIVGSTGDAVESNEVSVNVEPSLTISGKVWKENIHNNILDASEDYYQDIQKIIALFKYNEDSGEYEQVDEKFFYEKTFEFSGLSKGKYKLGFSDEQFWEEVSLVDKKVGEDDSINSKFNTTLTGDYYMTDVIDLSANKNAGLNQNLGYYAKGNVYIEKGIYKGEPDEENSVDGKKVNTNDILTITLKYWEYTPGIIARSVPVGDNLVKNVIVKDVISEDFIYQPGTLKYNGENISDDHIKNNVLTYLDDSVASEDENLITFDVKVSNLASGTILNTATIEEKDSEANPNESNTVGVYVEPEGKIVKKVDKTEASINDELTYTIELSNAKNAGLWENVIIEDQLPEGVEYIKGSTMVDGKAVADSVSNGKLTYSAGNIVENTTQTLTFKVKIIGKHANYINEALAKSSNDGDVKSIVETYYKNVVSKLTATKLMTDDDESDMEGQLLTVGNKYTYTIKVENTVKDSITLDLKITDAIPSGLEFVENSLRSSVADATLNHNKGVVTATIPKLDGGNSVSISFDVLVKGEAFGDIINKASYEGTDEDSNLVITGDSNEVKSLVEPKLSIQKVASVESIEAGKEFTYTIKVANAKGYGLAQEVYIQDILPKGVEYITGSTKIDDSDVSDTTIWKDNRLDVVYKNLLGGKTATITFNVKVDDDYSKEEVVNNVKAMGKYGNYTTEGIEDTVITPVTQPIVIEDEIEGGVKLSKVSSKMEDVKVGEEIEYTVTVDSIIENSELSNLVLTDYLPSNVELVSGSIQTEGVVSIDEYSNQFSITLPDMKGVQQYIIKYKVKVLESSEELIENRVNLTGNNGVKDFSVDANVLNKMYTGIDLLKEASVKEVRSGEEFVYTLESTIQEGSRALAYIIEDQLPEGLELVKNSVKLDGLITEYVYTGKILKVNVPLTNMGKKSTITFKVKAGDVDANTLYENQYSALYNSTNIDGKIEEVKVDSNIVVVKGKVDVKAGSHFLNNWVYIMALFIAITACGTLVYNKKK